MVVGGGHFDRVEDLLTSSSSCRHTHMHTHPPFHVHTIAPHKPSSQIHSVPHEEIAIGFPPPPIQLAGAPWV